MSSPSQPDEPAVEGQGDAEMPSDDIEIRDQPREAEELADDDPDTYSATGAVPESFDDPRDEDPTAG